MLLMKHEFVVEFPDRREWITSTLIDYGIPNGIFLIQFRIELILGASSMSRTVSLPVAIAVRLILEGKLKLTGWLKLIVLNISGLQLPTIPELHKPILEELEIFNIRFVEKVVKVEPK